MAFWKAKSRPPKPENDTATRLEGVADRLEDLTERLEQRLKEVQAEQRRAQGAT